MLRVMFLGGAVDHAVRLVPADEIDSSKPREMTYLNTKTVAFTERFYGTRYTTAAEPLPVETYQAVKFTSGPWRWWAYVLDGHEPSTSDVIDSNPLPFVNG